MLTGRKLNTLTSRVEEVLRTSPMARNSDIELQAELCELFMPPFERPIATWRDYVSVMQTLPTLDHIARARRIVIAKHKYAKYLPTDPDIAKARRINMGVWRQYAIENAPQNSFNNYPPDVLNKLETTGRTGIDD